MTVWSETSSHAALIQEIAVNTPTSWIISEAFLLSSIREMTSFNDLFRYFSPAALMKKAVVSLLLDIWFDSSFLLNLSLEVLWKSSPSRPCSRYQQSCNLLLTLRVFPSMHPCICCFSRYFACFSNYSFLSNAIWYFPFFQPSVGCKKG